MNSDQFERLLRRQGIEVTDKKGTGHKILTNPANGAVTELPTHGGRKQMKTGTMNAILKILGLK